MKILISYTLDELFKACKDKNIKDLKEYIHKDINTLKYTKGLSNLEGCKWYISVERSIFQIYIAKIPCDNGDLGYYVMLYNFNGEKQLAEFKNVKTFNLSLKRKIYRILSLYNRGIVLCSNCGAEVNVKSHNTFFAGTYCTKCWKDKFKDIAASETYE